MIKVCKTCEGDKDYHSYHYKRFHKWEPISIWRIRIRDAWRKLRGETIE